MSSKDGEAGHLWDLGLGHLGSGNLDGQRLLVNLQSSELFRTSFSSDRLSAVRTI